MISKWSLPLGRVAGIRIQAHWTFLILILWVFIAQYRISYSLEDAALGALFIVIIFGCVILHELGHALTAKRFGIQTRSILLLPIGGVASLERMPEKPLQELMVALAGPLVNLVIALILLIFLTLSGQMPSVDGLMVLTVGINTSMTGNELLFSLMLVNMLLAVFNLIPAFPMDGGRVLRAILAIGMDHMKATTVAARAGQVLAIAFVFVGIFGNFLLVFIGLFIFLGAAAEESQEKSKNYLRNNTVRDALMTNYTLLSPADRLERAVVALLDGQEDEFLVGEGNTISGILTRKALVKALSEKGKEAIVSDVMDRNVTALAPEMEVSKAQQQLLQSGSSIAPVVENGRLLGMVDLTNIAELIMVNEALRAH